jgi:hypothetical protein
MMLDRMRGDRWKVFKGQNDGWLEEFRMFHRDANGMFVKEGDDAISASRYAMMMLRSARSTQDRVDFDRTGELLKEMVERGRTARRAGLGIY